MYLRSFRFGICLVLCIGCLVGIYHLQAEIGSQARHQADPSISSVSQPQFPPQAQPHLRTETESLFAEDIHSDSYQTIIKNNLFAPLGTNLHHTPAPGATLTLIGTFVSEPPTHSTALIKHETTGRQRVLVLGEIFDDFQVVEIQPKQVTLDHNGESVRLRLPENLLLNAKRR